MELFESVLTLAAIAIALLQVSRRFAIPYPTMLAVAGVVVAALPWSPTIGMDPALAMALFIAPALLAAAYDLPPREMRRHWRALLSLAGVAVLLTTAAVAWTAVAMRGLSLPAAIALGAIVAPPDAAAARVRADYEIERAANAKGGPEASRLVRPRLSSLLVQRIRLAELRREGTIDDDVFHSLEQELDFAELAASPPGRLEIEEG